jgi:hypothetical protein
MQVNRRIPRNTTNKSPTVSLLHFDKIKTFAAASWQTEMDAVKYKKIERDFMTLKSLVQTDEVWW